MRQWPGSLQQQTSAPTMKRPAAAPQQQRSRRSSKTQRNKTPQQPASSDAAQTAAAAAELHLPPLQQVQQPQGMQHVKQSDWRLELFFKSSEELRSQLPFLRRFGLLSLNITNKAAEDDLLATLAELTAGLLPTPSRHQQQKACTPEQHKQQQQVSQAEAGHSMSAAAGSTAAPLRLDVCLHYSLKYNHDKTPERSLARLVGFCRDVQGLQQQHHQQQQILGKAGSRGSPAAAANGSNAGSQAADAVDAAAAALSVHVLLVSGGGKKKRFDTVAALQALQHHHQQQAPQQAGSSNGKRSDTSSSREGQVLPSLAVAFNPYLPGEADAAEERRRLRSKLKTGLVDRVYLQMGTDLDRLQSALDFVRQTVQQLSQEQPGFNAPELLGSVFLPSKRLLAQMKFRPWNGVFLSEEYLGSVEAAEGITRQLLGVYAAAGVVPLLESAVKTEEELERWTGMLGAVGSCRC